MKLWYRWFVPVFPLAQSRDGDGCLCLRHVTTVRKTSQLFKFGKSQKTLFSFCFGYIMIRAQHTECLERGRRVPWWVPNSLFQALITSTPTSRPSQTSQPQCMPLMVYCASVGFVLDWMPSRHPCWIGVRDRESACCHDEKSGVFYGLLQT